MPLLYWPFNRNISPEKYGIYTHQDAIQWIIIPDICIKYIKHISVEDLNSYLSTFSEYFTFKKFNKLVEIIKKKDWFTEKK